MVSKFLPAKPISLSSPLIQNREKSAVMRVLRSGTLTQGIETEQFESEFSSRLAGGRPCVAVNSGTSALHLGLLAAGIRPGDEIIVPAFSFAATANAVALAGAVPVFADIDADTFCLEPRSVEEVVGPRTVGIMPVHLFGHPAPMTELVAIARRSGLAIFEDAAQAHLAEYQGKLVGTFGSFAAFSFYPTKNMTTGEGGMVVCEDESMARRVRLLRNQGMIKKYANEVVGFNLRMSEINAALGRVQLSRIETLTSRRIKNATFLSRSIEPAITPIARPGVKHVFNQFTLRVNGGSRDEILKRLREDFFVSSAVYYPTPLHQLPALRSFPRNANLDASCKASEEVISIPVHPLLKRSELKRVAFAVNTVVEQP